MKWMFGLLCMFSMPVLAQTGSAADTYLATLEGVRANCETAAFKLSLDEDLASAQRNINARVAMANGREPTDSLVSTDDSKGNALSECEHSAPQIGADAYKKFINQTHSQKMKDAAEKLLSAWLAYLPAVKVTSDTVEQHSGLAYTDLQSAISDFKVEVLTEN